jgi:hypothetical protein
LRPESAVEGIACRILGDSLHRGVSVLP